ncbi:Crp/Fnr family transcriptional regulator [Chitinophaga costaii]|nr:Crp/Fnr family transcriptional regulator [Chitinophaga costaii]
MTSVIEQHATPMTIPPDEVILVPDAYVRILPFVLEGSIRIYRVDEEGKEIFLYYVEQSQTCAMSVLACLGGDKSKIKAVTETETHLLAIPSSFVENWMENQVVFRRFILHTCEKKFEDLFRAIDSLAFKKLDERLLDYIRESCKTAGNNFITMTHQELAREMNTSREVVSRLLKQMERQGLVRMARSRISLVKPSNN